jgi:hypothetical protein
MVQNLPFSHQRGRQETLAAGSRTIQRASRDASLVSRTSQNAWVGPLEPPGSGAFKSQGISMSIEFDVSVSLMLSK